MPDQSVLLDQVRRYFEYAGADVDRAHELYHDDAVLEFPQSGETAVPGSTGFNCSSSATTRWRTSGSTSWRAGRAPSGRAPWRSDTPADSPE